MSSLASISAQIAAINAQIAAARLKLEEKEEELRRMKKLKLV